MGGIQFGYRWRPQETGVPLVQSVRYVVIWYARKTGRFQVCYRIRCVLRYVTVGIYWNCRKSWSRRRTCVRKIRRSWLLFCNVCVPLLIQNCYLSVTVARDCCDDEGMNQMNAEIPMQSR